MKVLIKIDSSTSYIILGVSLPNFWWFIGSIIRMLMKRIPIEEPLSSNKHQQIISLTPLAGYYVL